MTGAYRGYLGLAAAVLLLCVSPGSAAGGGKVRVRAGLTATSVAPNARGQTALGIRGINGTFDVKAIRLERKASYDVVVKGIKVGTLQTNGGGSGRLRFRSRPRGDERVLGFDPRGAQLSVRDGTGHDVLVGTLPDGTVDPAAIACCVPDASGATTCQELAPDACTAASGTASQATTCIPDPCAATPPPAPTVCCTNETGDDESESECEDDDDDATECAAEGGTIVEATSCDPNPCAPVPPPSGDVVACCVTHADDDEDEGETEIETECEAITTEACVASGGTVAAGATCEPDPCASASGSDDDGDGDDGDDDGGGGDD